MVTHDDNKQCLIQSTLPGLQLSTLGSCLSSSWNGFGLGHSQAISMQSERLLSICAANAITGFWRAKVLMAKPEASQCMALTEQHRYMQLLTAQHNGLITPICFPHKMFGDILAAAQESQFLDHGRLLKDRV